MISCILGKTDDLVRLGKTHHCHFLVVTFEKEITFRSPMPGQWAKSSMEAPMILDKDCKKQVTLSIKQKYI